LHLSRVNAPQPSSLSNLVRVIQEAGPTGIRVDQKASRMLQVSARFLRPVGVGPDVFPTGQSLICRSGSGTKFVQAHASCA
jgi:hypothetical protein